MLRTNKATNLTGQVVINEQTVIIMNASIGRDNNTLHCSMTVQDIDLYRANLAQCRKGMAQFVAEMHEAEDSAFKQA